MDSALDLQSPENEWCFTFLVDKCVKLPDGTGDANLTWRVPAKELYARYCSAARYSTHCVISPDNFWGIIQLAFPKVKLIGPAGNRAFAGIRMKL